VTSPNLLAVPNVSEGRDASVIAKLASAFASQASAQADIRLLDVHSDRDHHRSVFTLAGRQRELADSLLSGARAAVESIDVVGRAAGDKAQAGAHPHVGAIDVVPLVYLDTAARGAACAAALVVGELIGGELRVPVFLYGELAGELAGRTRADLRRGGIAGLAARMSAAAGPDRLQPDFGPSRPHASAGVTLVAAREPLVAFNLQLQPPADLADARRIAALVREGGEQGLPGLRAIGVQLAGGVAQVSMNVERPLELSLAEVVRAVARHAPLASAELVGLAPRAALDALPDALPMPGFDAARHVIEDALGTDTEISDRSK
jgi:glutamate formiminotransferase/glutamate formiminotransferase/formiminotetrahydrofolate cyclodeaminase